MKRKESRKEERGNGRQKEGKLRRKRGKNEKMLENKSRSTEICEEIKRNENWEKKRRRK
jgi:hypothetical protein